MREAWRKPFRDLRRPSRDPGRRKRSPCVDRGCGAGEPAWEQRGTGREGGSENSKVVSHREGNWKEGGAPRPAPCVHTLPRLCCRNSHVILRQLRSCPAVKDSP